MPIHEFRCRACGTGFEALVRSQDPAPACPSCRSADLERQLSVPAVTSDGKLRAAADKAVKKAAKTGRADSAAMDREIAAHRAEDFT